MINTILPPNCFYIPNFLPDADILFDHFSKELDRKQYPITMFGKQMMQPRLVCFYGDDKVKYSYSQTKLIGIGWEPELDRVRRNIFAKTGYKVNSVLCNLYRDGNDSMGRHSDDEKELGPDPVIVSVTLGESRIFKMRQKQTKETIDILLEHGSALIMGSRSQIDREHCITKTSKEIGSRINLTFRKIG